MGIFNGIMTVILMALFTGIVLWAWRRERRKDFNDAAALPLEEDDGVVPRRPAGSTIKRGDSR